MKDIAFGKRLKISKAQQQIILAVLGTSLVLGVCIVLAIFFIKNMVFNSTIISEKDASIRDYEASLKDGGICQDTNGDGKFSDSELKSCDPNNIVIADVPDTLRSNILTVMAKNKNLEAVGRSSLAECYNEKGKKKDFLKDYEKAKDGDEKMYYLYMTKMCSALRAIPDALPAQQNDEALMASLNQIFILSNWQPESIAPSGYGEGGTISDLGSIPVTLAIESQSDMTLNILNNIERSIRTFEINTATVEWRPGGELDLTAQAQAFFTDTKAAKESTKTLYASDEARSQAGGNK